MGDEKVVSWGGELVSEKVVSWWESGELEGKDGLMRKWWVGERAVSWRENGALVRKWWAGGRWWVGGKYELVRKWWVGEKDKLLRKMSGWERWVGEKDELMRKMSWWESGELVREVSVSYVGNRSSDVVEKMKMWKGKENVGDDR